MVVGWRVAIVATLSACGTGRFLGQYNVCLTGEMTMDVPRATLEEAKRIILQSHVFDRPMRRCSSSLTDAPAFGIYFPSHRLDGRSSVSCAENKESS
jgi:hypothetical protein